MTDRDLVEKKLARIVTYVEGLRRLARPVRNPAAPLTSEVDQDPVAGPGTSTSAMRRRISSGSAALASLR